MVSFNKYTNNNIFNKFFLNFIQVDFLLVFFFLFQYRNRNRSKHIIFTINTKGKFVITNKNCVGTNYKN